MPNGKDVIEEWCLEHSADYPYPDSDGEDDRMSIAIDISNNDDDASSQSTMDYEGSARDNDPKHASENDRNTTSGSSIRVRELISIDESHSIVIDLVDAGFDLRQSIDAAI